MYIVYSMGESCYKVISKKGISILVVLILLIITSACDQAKRSEDVLAYINDLEITEAHLENAFKNVYYRSGRSLSPNYNTKKAVLESEFRTYVLATHAIDLGYGDDEASKREEGIIYRKVLSEEFLDQSVLNKIKIEESDLREIFLRFNTTLRASHLYASDKATADSLYNLLSQGKSFEELASEVFQNEYLKENGGDLGEFQTDEMDIAFENAAHRLKVGEFSKPVKTSQGYSIIKLTDRYKKPLITEYEYANQKANLTRFVKRRKSELATRSHLQAITDNFEIDDSAVNELWSWVGENRDLFDSDNVELLQSIAVDADLVKLEDFTFTTADFLTETYFTPAVSRAKIRSRSQFDDYIKGVAYRKYAVQQAEDMKINEQEMVKGSIDQTYYVYLQNRALDHLNGQIEITPEEIREEYYKSPKDYVTPIQLSLSRIVTETEEDADAAIAELKSSSDFNKVFRKYSTKLEDRATNGDLGFMPLTQLGTLGPVLNKLEKGGISDPIQYQSNEYHIYQCNDRIESRALSFEEARVQIEPMIRKIKLDQVIKETVAQVKSKHNAFVDDQAIREFTINL